MASTQKTVLLILFINLVLISIPPLTSGTYDDMLNKWDTYAQEQQDVEQSFADKEGNWFVKTAGAVADYAGNIIEVAFILGGILWIFVGGLVQSPVHYIAGMGSMETLVTLGLQFFRLTFIMLIFLELFMFVRNRKTSS